jgi:LmbE family N-acetylglucosaminyl deacetylase
MKKTLPLLVLFISLYINALATIVVMSPHPDDAESSCGGMIANAVRSGEKVIILTMTKGEIGIGGKTREEAAKIRGYEADVRYAEAYLRARNYDGMGGRPSVVPKVFNN